MLAYRWFVVVIVAILSATGSLSAAEKGKSDSLSREAYERRVRAALYKTALEGVELYNNGQKAAAAYYFQAAATALVPFLDHHPDLQEKLQKALADAQDEPNAATRGENLGKALVNVSDETGERRLPRLRKPKHELATLWERLGEEEGVTEIVDEFVKAALENRKINFTRNNAYLQNPEDVKKLKRHLVELTSALGKGPLKYDGRSMKEIHKNMRITDAEFDELRKELRIALLSNRVNNEDVAFILAGYDNTHDDIVRVKREPQPPGFLPLPGTLWAELGGEEGVTTMVGELIDTALKDKRVNLSRNDKYLQKKEEIDALKRQFVALASALGKGPLKYDGRSMLDAHKGMGITDAEFDAFVEDLEAVLKKNRVKLTTIYVVTELVKSKRRDIVEKPQKNSEKPQKNSEKPQKIGGPDEKTRPAQTFRRTDRHPSNGLSGDVLLGYFLPPLIFPLPILFLLK